MNLKLRKEKEKKAQPKMHVNLSIANPAWIPCSLHLSLFLSKTTPKLKKMEIGEWNGVLGGIGSSFSAKYILF